MSPKLESSPSIKSRSLSALGRSLVGLRSYNREPISLAVVEESILSAERFALATIKLGIERDIARGYNSEPPIEE